MAFLLEELLFFEIFMLAGRMAHGQNSIYSIFFVFSRFVSVQS